MIYFLNRCSGSRYLIQLYPAQAVQARYISIDNHFRNDQNEIRDSFLTVSKGVW